MKTAVILNDTSYESHHGCETVIKNIINLLNDNEIKTIDTNPVGLNWLENKSFLESMSKSDIVIVNGEGTLHHAQPRAKELVTIGKYVKDKLKLPVVLINSTYQENGNEIAEFMKYLDLIFVRETLSLKDLEQFNLKSKVVPDMTFYSEYNLSHKNTSNVVGVTDSVYIELSQELYDLSLKNNNIYLPALTNPKIRINTIKNILRFIKFNIYKNIKSILHKIGYQLNHQSVRMFYYTNGYENYIQQIANLKFLVVARYHSLCFALKTSTPFVAIKSNSHKIEGMLEDIGIGNNRIVDEKKIENIEVKEFTQEELIKINQYIETAPLRIESMFKDIRALLDN
jgi:polysaccharide pyruvyl transferase WcaK-like protein